jgi:acrylyl-CoA reductase (NADPH)
MYGFLCTDADTPGSWQELPEPSVATPKDQTVLRLAVSGINYKDALAALGKAPILRHLPMVPGIDGAGYDDSGRLCMIAGRGSGEDISGSWAQHQVVRRSELIELPPHWTAQAAMALGTAGLTAAMGIIRLRQVLGPDLAATTEQPVAITGAAGGVGLWALRLCHAAGIPTAAVTGKKSKDIEELLTAAGATYIIERASFLHNGAKPLTKERFAAGIDATGGPMLQALLPQIMRDGAVATAGVAAGNNLNTTMFPFILRGVALLGLASSYCEPPLRHRAWQLITNSLNPTTAAQQCTPLAPKDALGWCQAMLNGETSGRGVIDWSLGS